MEAKARKGSLTDKIPEQASTAQTPKHGPTMLSRPITPIPTRPTVPRHPSLSSNSRVVRLIHGADGDSLNARNSSTTSSSACSVSGEKFLHRGGSY